jgi:hypothetical protein
MDPEDPSHWIHGAQRAFQYLKSNAVLETRILPWVSNFSVRFFRHARKNYNCSVGFQIYPQKNSKTYRKIITFFRAWE